MSIQVSPLNSVLSEIDDAISGDCGWTAHSEVFRFKDESEVRLDWDSLSVTEIESSRLVHD